MKVRRFTMKLPEKIQRERKKMGLSQEKLAEKIGVSRQATEREWQIRKMIWSFKDGKAYLNICTKN